MNTPTWVSVEHHDQTAELIDRNCPQRGIVTVLAPATLHTLPPLLKDIAVVCGVNSMQLNRHLPSRTIETITLTRLRTFNVTDLIVLNAPAVPAPILEQLKSFAERANVHLWLTFEHLTPSTAARKDRVGGDTIDYTELCTRFGFGSHEQSPRAVSGDPLVDRLPRLPSDFWPEARYLAKRRLTADEFARFDRAYRNGYGGAQHYFKKGISDEVVLQALRNQWATESDPELAVARTLCFQSVLCKRGYNLTLNIEAVRLLVETQQNSFGNPHEVARLQQLADARFAAAIGLILTGMPEAEATTLLVGALASPNELTDKAPSHPIWALLRMAAIEAELQEAHPDELVITQSPRHFHRLATEACDELGIPYPRARQGSTQTDRGIALDIRLSRLKVGEGLDGVA